MTSDKIRDCVNQALAAAGFASMQCKLEHPADSVHGDYATNIALVLAKETGRAPREVAEELSRHIEECKPAEVGRVTVAGPGFINFYLTDDFFTREVERIVSEGGRYVGNTRLSGKKVMVEYTDPNAFKEFHIGHLMSNAIGESLSRIIEFSGAEVARANYQGDVGLHVAKAIWGKKQSPELSWGEAYAHGAQAYEAGEPAKTEIHALNKVIYERSDEQVNRLYDEGRRTSLDAFEVLYRRLGTRFDRYFFESDMWEPGKKMVQEGLAKGVFEQSEGAVVFRGEKYGLHTRVFLTSEGLAPYEAKDLALAKMKYEKFPYDLSVIVTANEQAAYWQVVKKAMSMLSPDLAEKTRHVSHGMLRLSSGKMSSRTGVVITGASLLDDVKRAVEEKMSNADIDATERDKVEDMIAVGAVKYSILKQSAGRDIIFDTKRALSLEGDSGPYLQYAYVRTRSVLEKARAQDIAPKQPATNSKQTATAAGRLLYQFPEVVERALEEYEPHYITTYLTALAGAFNSYYATYKIIDPSNLEMTNYRLALTTAVGHVLKRGLWLLGVEAPERM